MTKVMKVKMLTMAAGPAGNRHIGQVVEVSADEAKQLIDGRYAEPFSASQAETEEEAAEFEVVAFLKQNQKKVLAGVDTLDRLQLEAALAAELDGANRDAVVGALQARLEEFAGA